jgi:hypothetical protein
LLWLSINGKINLKPYLFFPTVIISSFVLVIMNNDRLSWSWKWAVEFHNRQWISWTAKLFNKKYAS